MYRGHETFVAIDMAPRETSFNICLGRLAGGRLPPYPIFRPADSERLEWIPLWALAERDGETVERLRFARDDDQLRSELGRWAALLRVHGTRALTGDPIDADGRLLPPREAVPDRSRAGEQRGLVIGQSQLRRVLAYAKATDSKAFVPTEVLEDKPFFRAALSFIQTALQDGTAIRDIGPDPLVQGDGGLIYALWQTVIGADRLRTMALDAVRLGLPEPPPDHSGVAGAVIDVPADAGFATLVAMGDGTTSMYTSTGGGWIGAGTHPPVAAATQALLSTLDEYSDQFVESADQGHPPPGKVRFFVLTPSGRRVADVPEDAFWGRIQHPLTPAVMAAQRVVTELRQAPGAER